MRQEGRLHKHITVLPTRVQPTAGLPSQNLELFGPFPDGV